MRFVGVVLVIAAGRVAAADPSPVDLNIGLGVTGQRWNDDLTIDQDSKGLELDAVLYVQVGVPVYRDLVVMVHGSTTAPKILNANNPNPIPGQTVQALPFRYLPIELGVGAEYTFPYDIWVSPWVGVEKLVVWNLDRDLANPTSFAFGFEAGIDLYQDDTGSRTGLFVKTALMPHIHPTGANESAYFLQLGAGIAYRFR
ncbi:MAG: hypothetical protein ABI591_27315 [Kofleriaceae bacterium]